MSLGPRYTCGVCDGFVNVPRAYKGSGRCRCGPDGIPRKPEPDPSEVRDLGNGRFGVVA